MSGAEMRKLIKNSGLKLWIVAESFGVRDTEFSKMLRHGFTEDETKQLLDIIEKLKKEKAVD